MDPDTGRNGTYDILVDGGIIKRVAKEIKDEGFEVVDAKGCIVMPGLVDLHVHLRDPGFTQKETIKTGSLAAAKGGFTTIVAMGNTMPAIDNPETLKYVLEKAEKEAAIHVLSVATLTKGMEGKELTDIKALKDAGAAALSEDGRTVMNAAVFRDALKLAAENGLLVLDHCEDADLKGRGAVSAGAKAKELGLIGISNAVEDVIIARDILLAAEEGASLHICHCSTKGSVEMIRQAKKAGIPVTGEVCPHHFTLTTEDIKAGDSNYKMAPPLREREDAEALKQGLREGIMDVISTDHAPHAPEEKGSDIASAAFGIVGLETAVGLTVTELVRPGILTYMQMAKCMSLRPAQLLGIDKGSLAEGKPADIVVIKDDKAYSIDKNGFLSKGRNTPFHGREVYGKVMYTICDGKVVWAQN